MVGDWSLERRYFGGVGCNVCWRRVLLLAVRNNSVFVASQRLSVQLE
jgi:hypothetical protein